MKKLIICMFAVLGICSCGNKEKMDYIDSLGVYLTSQKIDGKLKYGVAIIDTLIEESYAEKGEYELKDETYDVFGVQHTVKEKWIGQDKLQKTEIIRQTFLENKYDSISFITYLEHPFWRTLRDGKKQLFTLHGKELLDGKQPQKILQIGKYPFGHYFVRDISPVNLITTDDGCYLLCGNNQFGPYQFIYPGISGYFYAENGKFGFCADKYNRTIDDGIYKNKDFSHGKILPPVFESVIEVYQWGNSQSYLFLGFQDGKWQAFNQFGKKTSVPADKLKIYTSLSVTSVPTEYMQRKEKGSICRYGTTATSVVVIY